MRWTFLIVFTFEPNSDRWLDPWLCRMFGTAWSDQYAVALAPELQVVPKALAMLCVKSCDDYFDNNLWCRLLVITPVGAAKEVVFIDDLASG